MLDKDMLEVSKRNAILINYSEDENKEKLPKGSSKIGGKPDLPRIFNGFTLKGRIIKIELKTDRFHF